VTEPLLVSVRQAAQELGIGRDAAYALVRSGIVRSVTVGRKRLIPRSELAAWIERELGGGEDVMGNGTGKEKAPDLVAAESRA
jgi:excisionase family DNA binding protein